MVETVSFDLPSWIKTFALINVLSIAPSASEAYFPYHGNETFTAITNTHRSAAPKARDARHEDPFVLSQYAFKVAMIFKHLQVTMLYTSGSPGLGCNIACSDLSMSESNDQRLLQRNRQLRKRKEEVKRNHCQGDHSLPMNTVLLVHAPMLASVMFAKMVSVRVTDSVMPPERLSPSLFHARLM